MKISNKKLIVYILVIFLMCLVQYRTSKYLENNDQSSINSEENKKIEESIFIIDFSRGTSVKKINFYEDYAIYDHRIGGSAGWIVMANNEKIEYADKLEFKKILKELEEENGYKVHKMKFHYIDDKDNDKKRVTVDNLLKTIDVTYQDGNIYYEKD